MGVHGGAGSGGGPRGGGSLLPPSRSFVVQFSDDTAPPSGRFLGRVEHIESGRSRRFASLEELVAFVSEVLATV
jgi:hypothetical protein